MPGMVAFSRPHPIVLLNRLTTGWSSSSEKQTLSTKSRAILESIYGVISHFPKHYTSLGVQDRNVEEGIFSDSRAKCHQHRRGHRRALSFRLPNMPESSH